LKSAAIRDWAPAVGVCLLNTLLLWHFHDRYWYPTDDGFYAHLAERLSHGEVLNVALQDIHPGYIHFLHAAAFRIFGEDIVTLRYPLMLAALAQAAFAFALLRRRNALFALIGSVAMTALGVVQFYNPTPNWYCLSLCVMLACWLDWLPTAHPARLFGAGLLVGVLTMFRQLSGVWVMMALLVLAMLERSSGARGRGVLLSRALLTTMVGGLVAYLVLSPETEPGGLLLFAAWPLAILGWMLVRTRTTNAAVGSVIGQVGAGAALPALPLVAYHAVHGSIGGWVSDTVLAAFGETQMPFFGHGWYGVLPLAGLYQALSSTSPAKIFNGVYWAVVPLIAMGNGVLILRKLRRTTAPEELTLPILASFHSLVSLYLEGPLYLYYSAGLSLLAFLWLTATGSRPRQAVIACSSAALVVIALVYHAGQSRTRTPIQSLQGVRVSNVWRSSDDGLDRCSLRLEPEDRAVYGSLVATIQGSSEPDESIFAMPNDAELYFLARRRNPFRFYNTALGMRTRPELDHVLQVLRTDPPRLVIFRPDDKYNDAASRQVMVFVRSKYTRIAETGGLQVYRRP
jgi:hypothetical protein